jgi:hypothetical protein
VRPEGGQELVQLRDGLVAEHGQFAVSGDQHVGRHHTRPARIGDDCQPVALGMALACQQFGAVEHVFDFVNPLDSRTLKRRFVHGVHAGHRPGVRGGRLGRFVESTRLERHDRLGSSERPGSRHEPAGLADRFDVKDDRLGIRGRAEEIDQVAHVHVEHVAHRNEVREANALFHRPVEHGRAQRAGLGDESDVALGGHGGGKAGVQTDARHDHPQAVRPHDPHALELPLLLDDHPLQLPTLLADFTKSGRDDYHTPGACLAAASDDPGNRRSRRANHRQVGWMRQTGNVLVRLDPLDGFPSRIDRVDHAAEARTNQVAKYRVAHARRGVAGADNRHPVRIENLVKVFDTHVFFSKHWG